MFPNLQSVKVKNTSVFCCKDKQVFESLGPPPSANQTKLMSNICAVKTFVCAVFVLKILIKVSRPASFFTVKGCKT